MGNVVTDGRGCEIHVGDVVFSSSSFELCVVERFSEVVDRGEAFSFVHVVGKPEPLFPGSVEVVQEGDLDDEDRWHLRRDYCDFDVRREWERLMRDAG